MTNYGRRTGSVFVFTMWVLVMLSIFALMAGKVARTRIEFLKRIDARGAMRAIALSGLNSMANDISNANTDNKELLFLRVVKAPLELDQKTGDTSVRLIYNHKIDICAGNFYASITDEQSRLNINRADTTAIQNLIVKVGAAKEDQALILANAIVDWRDNDNSRPGEQTINNEDTYYKIDGVPYVPKNADFESLEELLLVKDMDPVVAEMLYPYITVYGSGTVNINTASIQVLSALGASDELIRKIEVYRSGKRANSQTGSKFFRLRQSIVEDLKEEIYLKDEEVRQLVELISANRIDVDTDCFRASGTIFYINEIKYSDAVINRNGDVKYYREYY